MVDSGRGRAVVSISSPPAEEAVAESPAAGGEAALAAGMGVDPGLAADAALAMPVPLVEYQSGHPVVFDAVQRWVSRPAGAR